MAQSKSSKRPKPPSAELEEARRLMALMNHSDWYLMERSFAETAESYHKGMDTATKWDEFVADRAVWQFLVGEMLPLRENIKIWLEAQEGAPIGLEDIGTNPLED